MNLYLAVTNDEYELPVYVEDTVTALAAKVGLGRVVMSRHISGKVKFSRTTEYKYLKVEVDE